VGKWLLRRSAQSLLGLPSSTPPVFELVPLAGQVTSPFPPRIRVCACVPLGPFPTASWPEIPTGVCCSSGMLVTVVMVSGAVTRGLKAERSHCCILLTMTQRWQDALGQLHLSVGPRGQKITLVTRWPRTARQSHRGDATLGGETHKAAMHT